MLTIDELQKSIKEAERFIEKAKAAITRLNHEGHEPDAPVITGNRKTGAARRASMDLSQQLVKLRSYK